MLFGFAGVMYTWFTNRGGRRRRGLIVGGKPKCVFGDREGSHT